MMMGVVVMGFGMGLSGCSDEAGTKKEAVTTGPGGKTTVTEETKIKQSGENPPAPAKP
jgi:hypothetical protein